MEKAPSKEKLIFDREGALNRLGDDEALLEEILGVYFEDTPRQLEALKEAVERGDSAAIRRQAHTLKGSSGNVGAVSMQEVAFQIEKAGETGDLARTASLFETIEKEFDKLLRISK